MRSTRHTYMTCTILFCLHMYVCMCMMEPVIVYGQTVALDRYLHLKNMKRQLYFDPREVIERDLKVKFTTTLTSIAKFSSYIMQYGYSALYINIEQTFHIQPKQWSYCLSIQLHRRALKCCKSSRTCCFDSNFSNILSEVMPLSVWVAAGQISKL